MAGAGTGKTQTLTDRFLFLVGSGVPAHQILAVTFTSKAAQELQQRVLDGLNASYKRLWITTFHGLCRELLKEWNARSGNPPLLFLDEAGHRLLIERAVQSIDPDDWRFYRSQRGLDNLVKDLGTLIDRTKDQLLEREDIAQFAAAMEDPRLLDLARGFAACEELRLSEQTLGFSDLGFDVVKHLRSDPRLLDQTRARFKHLLVDEFQDVNEVQFQLLRSLAPDDSDNLCIVGDPNQAIYAFRGGKSEYIRTFPTLYPNAATYQLLTNYRSGQPILDVANRLISRDDTAERFELRADDPDRTASVEVVALASDEHEAEWIARRIRLLLRDENDALAFSDIAILLRSVIRSAEPIQRALALNGIPYRTGRSLGAEFPIVQDLLAALRIIISEVRWEDVSRLAIRRDIDPALLRRIEIVVSDPDQRHELLQTPQDLPEGLPPLAGNALFAMRELVKEFQSFREKTLTDLFYEALRATAHLYDGLNQNTASFLGDLSRTAETMARADATPEEFLQQLVLAWDSRQEFPSDDQQGVQISTVHAAKGLEWPVVFVAGLADGVFPSQYRRDRELDLDLIIDWKEEGAGFTPSDEATLANAYLAEERRLAYVAMTRARNALFLTVPMKASNRSLTPSLFVTEALGEPSPAVDGRRGGDEAAVSVRDLAARLHTRRSESLATTVDQAESASALADLLLAEWAVGKVPGVVPMRDRRQPAPHDGDTPLVFSFSRLESYDTCPKQYFYSRVLKIDTDEESENLVFGSVLHRALESLNREWEETDEIPGDQQIKTALSKAWDGISLAVAQQQAQLEQRSLAMLRRFYEFEQTREPKRRPIAVETPIAFQFGRHKLTGKIDLIVEDENGVTEIIDFKSGKAGKRKRRNRCNSTCMVRPGNRCRMDQCQTPRSISSNTTRTRDSSWVNPGQTRVR